METEQETPKDIFKCNGCDNIITTLEDDCYCPICYNGNIEIL